MLFRIICAAGVLLWISGCAKEEESTVVDPPKMGDLGAIEETPGESDPVRKEVLELLAQNQPFDFTFSLPDTHGATHSLVDLKGKVVIVDIWGTWCPPCRMEIPHFVDLRSKYGAQGFEVVGINYERGPEDQWTQKINDFAAEQNVSYPCLIGDDATRDMIPNFVGFPTTLFLDRSGTVRLKLVGYHPMEQLEAIVQELLGPEPKDA